MSKTKEYRIVINKIKKAVKEEMNHAIHWELSDWSYEGELYVKSMVCNELAEEFINNEIDNKNSYD